MKKRISVLVLLFASSQAHSNRTLENSVWGSAAASAGINVATLYGIAAQESGMYWDDGTFRPWPWTLNVNEEKNGIKSGARRYTNRQSAEQALTYFISKGIRNIDVGIMQVNLYWHSDKVPNDLELLDPKTNISVAANYLKNLKQKNGVGATVAKYHAPLNPERGYEYMKRVKHYESIINENHK